MVATAIVHATKDEIPEIFDRVLSQTPDCHKPTIIKSDYASEYHTQQLRAALKKQNAQAQLHSNEHQQFQNGRAEKLVDSIGRKIRGMLLQSQMPTEFCGAASVLATEYNSHLIVILAWNHLIITGITSSPTSHSSMLLDVLLLCMTPILGYMPLLTPDLMRHTFLFAHPIRECMVRITPPLSCLSTTT